MSSRAPACAWLAACAVVLPSVGAAQTRTAQDLVETIVRDGPRALAIRAEAEVVRRDQESRVAFPNPGVSYSRESAGFTEFLQVEQPLPIFGVRGALTRAGVAARTSAEAERDARLWDLRVEATRLVARWVWAEQRATATASDVEAVARLVEVLRVREREGEGSRFDRLRMEQELADLQQVATSAAIEVSDARGAIVALLPPGVTVTGVEMPSAGGTTPIDIEGLWTKARGTRAELRALQAAGEHALLEADAAKRARWPGPIVSGGLKRADAGTDRERGGVFGLSLAVPLFDTGAREAARWSAEGARIAAERTAIEQQVHSEIQRAAAALTSRRQALADGAGDPLGAELVTTAEVAYREGEIGVVALLDAVRTASRARLRDLERRLDLRLAEIALERAVGERLWP
jgi:cobalt-zinc-cadmium efflux system outer membrane protein